MRLLAYPEAAAASGGLVAIDLNTGTTVNAGMFGGSSSWGTTSTVQIAALHGRFDVGNDGGLRYVDIGAPPAGAQGLHVRLTCTGEPASNATGGITALLASVSRGVTIAANRGYTAGFRCLTAGTLKAGTVKVWGTGVGSDATVTGDLQVDLYVAFPVDTATGALSGHSGVGSGSDGGVDDTTLDGTFGAACYVGIGVENANASPSGTQTWSGVALSYEWLGAD